MTGAAAWIEHGGLIAIFLLMLLDSCGLPLASEVTGTVAGSLAAAGYFSLVGAIVVGVLGTVAGSLVAYVLARAFGTRLLLGPGRRVGFSPSHLQLAQRWFDRWGMPTVFIGRLLPVVRTYISFPAGLAKLAVVPFTILTALGGAIWSTALAVAGYQLAANYDRLASPLGKAAIVIGLVMVGVVVWWFVHGRHLAQRRREARRGTE